MSPRATREPAPRSAATRGAPGDNRGSGVIGLSRRFEVQQCPLIVGALQRIAGAEGEAVKWSGVDTLSVNPKVTVLGATREGDSVLVRFGYDFAIYRFAQSGSDWTELEGHANTQPNRDATHQGLEVVERPAKAHSALRQRSLRSILKASRARGRSD